MEGKIDAYNIYFVERYEGGRERDKRITEDSKKVDNKKGKEGNYKYYFIFFFKTT